MGYTNRTSNDKPDFAFGLPMLDDGSVRKSLFTLARIQKRNFVVMEMQSMLLQSERETLLSSYSGFKRVVVVVAGEPNEAFKKETLAQLLQDKQKESDAAFKKKLEAEKAAKL